MLSITYKYLPECKCSCPNEGIICNTPCHIAESVWIATCSNGQISGTKYLGHTTSGSPLSGLVSESSIVLQYGDSTSHGSRWVINSLWLVCPSSWQINLSFFFLSSFYVCSCVQMFLWLIRPYFQTRNFGMPYDCVLLVYILSWFQVIFACL